MAEIIWTAQLTAPELVLLMGLLEINPAPSSILAEWLSKMDWKPSDTTAAGLAVKTLVHKSMLSAAEGGYAVDSRLNQVLLLAAEAGTDVVVHRRTAAQAQVAYFAQSGDRVFQYLFDGKTVVLYCEKTTADLVRAVLPDAVQVQKHEGFNETFSYPAFLLILEAGWKFFEDLALTEAGEGFSVDELLASLKLSLENEASPAWLGFDASVDLDALPVHSIVQDLIERGLFRSGPENRLKIGLKAAPLLRIISDPGLYTAACSFANTSQEMVRAASWYCGGGGLLQVELRDDGALEVKELFNAEVAREWLNQAAGQFAQIPVPTAQSRRAYWDKQLAERKLSEIPAGRLAAGRAGKTQTRRPAFVGCLLTITGSLLSALVIGLLSTTILGMLQGKITLQDISSQLFSWRQGSAPAEISSEAEGDQAAEESEAGAADVSAAEAVIPGIDESVVIAALTVEDSRVTTDRFGYLTLVGLLHNGGDFDVRYASIKVTLTENSEVIFEDYAYTRVPIRAGETGPFELYLWGLKSYPKTSEVQMEIVEAAAWPVDTVLDVQLSGVYSTLAGWDNNMLMVLGEISNPYEQPVSVRLSGLLRDNSGNLLAVPDGWAFQEILLPEERAPFSLRFAPGEGSFDPQNPDLEIFFGAVINETFAAEPAISLSQNQLAYVDGSGDFHLVGQVLNEESGPHDVSIIAAVYDADGQVVDVCDQRLVPEGLPSGSITAYDIRCWDRVTNLQENDALRAQVQTFDLMVDRSYALQESDRTAQLLDVGKYTVNIYDSTIEVQGLLTPAAGDFEVVSVVVNVRDTASNMLVGSASTELSPGTTEFSLYIQTDPASFNPDTLEFSVERYGY